MTEVKKEPLDVLDDGLTTLASAAVSRDSMSCSKQQEQQLLEQQKQQQHFLQQQGQQQHILEQQGLQQHRLEQQRREQHLPEQQGQQETMREQQGQQQHLQEQPGQHQHLLKQQGEQQHPLKQPDQQQHLLEQLGQQQHSLERQGHYASSLSSPLLPQQQAADSKSPEAVVSLALTVKQETTSSVTPNTISSDSGSSHSSKQSQVASLVAPIVKCEKEDSSLVAADGIYARCGGRAPSQMMVKAAALSEPPWFDVGIVRSTSCVVSGFYLTAMSVDHSADTSDCPSEYVSVPKQALLPGTAYKFRVAAVNACGIGEWSDVSAFKTCLPGFPAAPCSIRISKLSDGATIKWQPPTLRCGRIIEYSVCLAIEKRGDGERGGNVSLKDLPFVRVYCGAENSAFVADSVLEAAYIDCSVKPAIIFRIAARNEKGYGPATQVRWLQDYPGAEERIRMARKRRLASV